MAHILLVDDDPQVVAEGVAALEAAGHTVSAASTTSEATSSILRKMPDVVVLEGMLDGGFAGFDLARKLAHQYPQLPLVMVSRADEHLSDQELERQDRDGWMPVARFMQKPVSAEVLTYEVERLLHGGH
jgi:DNA-binding response OmpR family regulator